jgi:hypothetical protein
MSSKNSRRTPCERYQIVTASNPENLERKVHKMVCRGLIPIGGASAYVNPRSGKPGCMQAMGLAATMMNVNVVRAIENLVRRTRMLRPEPVRIHRHD